MSSELPVVDAAILKQTRGIADALRNAMVFCREVREADEPDPVEVKLLEDFLFLQTTEVAALIEQIEARLAAYREVVTSANTAILSVDADDREMAGMLALIQRGAAQMEARLRARIIAPSPQAAPASVLPSNVIVFTGSYRPKPANDASAPGGVA